MRKRKFDNEQGFTILELLIATTVFSVILLIATAGIVQIGRNYYKGITSSRTQETARAIEDEVTRAIQVSGLTSISNGSNDEVQALCVGNTRYSYVLDKQLQRDSEYKHVMWVDTKLPGAGVGCPPLNLKENQPVDFAPPATIDTAFKNQQRELIPTNMRLSSFKVEEKGAGLYEVSLKVMYGHDDVIEKGAPGVEDDTCKPSRFGGQFCASAGLTTFVKRRL